MLLHDRLLVFVVCMALSTQSRICFAHARRPDKRFLSGTPLGTTVEILEIPFTQMFLQAVLHRAGGYGTAAQEKLRPRLVLPHRHIGCGDGGEPPAITRFRTGSWTQLTVRYDWLSVTVFHS